METTNNELQNGKNQIIGKSDLSFDDSVIRMLDLATLIDCLNSTLSELEQPKKVVKKIKSGESIDCQTMRQIGIEAYKQHLFNAKNIISLMKNIIEKVKNDVEKATSLINETEKIK